MRILVVNVNTSETMTKSISIQAKAVAAPGTEIIPLTPIFGAPSVEGNYESYLSAIAVIETILDYSEPFDAVIQAGYGEHGREGLQELFSVPIVDITEAAASTAMYLGREYSVITSMDRTVPLIEDRLKLAGLDARCASVRASGIEVLDLDRHPGEAQEAIVAVAERAVVEDRAEVICLGCAGMSMLNAQVAARLNVPVIDGVTAAVTVAESLVRLGLSTSKIRTYAPTRHKTLKNWPPPSPQGPRKSVQGYSSERT